MLMMNSEALERLERHMECLVGKIMEELKDIKKDVADLRRAKPSLGKAARK